MPLVNDCDRLRLAFEDLDSVGIIAIAHAALNMTNAMTDVRSEERYRRDLGQVCRGYCFYHSQDILRAAEDGVLYIAWGTLDAAESDHRCIAIEILETLARHDLTARWSGEVGHRITLPVESPRDVAAWPPMFVPRTSARQKVIDEATNRLRDAIEVVDDQGAWRSLIAAGQPQEALNIALVMAARWGRTQAVRDLLAAGADPEWQEEHGFQRTALHAVIEGALAARRATSAGIPVQRSYSDHFELIGVLVKAMRRSDHRNSFGLTAAEEAQRAEALDLISILKIAE